ncbi:hypothetical protein [Bacillus manliponensis]|uniref:hypothetical protein n=1 Tax=Bacillus manliponensis TaxID=574376 RepID=UPI003511D7D8
MLTISSVVISLDDDIPEYMEGLIRIGSAEFYDANGNIIDNGSVIRELNSDLDLIDNTEFHSEEELKEYVAKKLKINPDDVEIE